MFHIATKNQHLIFSVMRNITTVTLRGKQANIAKCVDKAYEKFIDSHPHWEENLFDQNFVECQLKPLIKAVWGQGKLPSAVDIAMLWDSQFSGRSFELRRSNLEQLIEDMQTFVIDLRRNFYNK